MEWTPAKGSTQSGGATRAPNGPSVDPTGEAKRGQAAELLDADIKAGYVGGVAGARAPDPARRTADEQRVTAQIHAALRKAGVPPPQVVFKPIVTKGIFMRRTWTLLINAKRFHDAGDRIALLGTVYHEARHAEQFFDAIRVAASLQPTASAQALARWIVARGEVAPPLAIIEAARQRPPTKGESDKWFRLYFGRGAQTYRDKQFDRKVAKMVLSDLLREKARLLERQERGHPITVGVRKDYNDRVTAARAAVTRSL